MLSRRERLEITAEAVAQLAFGPDAERRRLLAAPTYKVPPLAHLPECHGFADGWGCEQDCPIAEAAASPVEVMAEAVGVKLVDWQKTILNDAANRLNDAANRRAE
jgi:hypothetical protein